MVILFLRRLQIRRFCVCVRSPVEEGVAERIELPERFLGVNHESVAGDDALVLAIHHCDEAICRGLRPDPHPGKILLQQVPETRAQSQDLNNINNL